MFWELVLIQEWTKYVLELLLLLNFFRLREDKWNADYKTDYIEESKGKRTSIIIFLNE